MVTCDSDYVWRSWSTSTDSCYSSTSFGYETSTASSNIVWSHWISNSGASYCSGTTDGTWQKWVTVYYTVDDISTVGRDQPVLSEEELRIRRERESERQQAEAEARRLRVIERQKSIEEENKRREEAEQVAKSLLLDLIGEEELKVYEETGRVLVKGREFDYIIQKSGFLQKITKTKVVDLCVHLQNKTKYPQTDNVIALMLGIQNEESEILKMANNHGSRNRPKELPKCAKVA
jgi:hypothetical protein